MGWSWVIKIIYAKENVSNFIEVLASSGTTRQAMGRPRQHDHSSAIAKGGWMKWRTVLRAFSARIYLPSPYSGRFPLTHCVMRHSFDQSDLCASQTVLISYSRLSFAFNLIYLANVCGLPLFRIRMQYSIWRVRWIGLQGAHTIWNDYSSFMLLIKFVGLCHLSECAQCRDMEIFVCEACRGTLGGILGGNGTLF